MWNSIKSFGKKVRLWVIGLLTAIGIISVTMAGTKDFTWSNPTERVDGSPLPADELAEVRMYCDGSLEFTVGQQPSVEAFSHDLTYGEHTCYATAVDTFGLESEPSNSVTFTVAPARPNPPVLD